MAIRPVTVSYDHVRKTHILPGRIKNLDEFVRMVAKTIKLSGMSSYKVSLKAGVTPDSVKRLLKGCEGTGDAYRVNEPERAGRVYLSTFLKIVNAMDLDVALVARVGDRVRSR